MNGLLPVIPFFMWALLLLPGYAIARRLVPDELESGPIAGIAICACSFMALLLPVLALAVYQRGRLLLAAHAACTASACSGGRPVRTAAHASCGLWRVQCGERSH